MTRTEEAQMMIEKIQSQQSTEISAEELDTVISDVLSNPAVYRTMERLAQT